MMIDSILARTGSGVGAARTRRSRPSLSGVQSRAGRAERRL